MTAPQSSTPTEAYITLELDDDGDDQKTVDLMVSALKRLRDLDGVRVVNFGPGPCEPADEQMRRRKLRRLFKENCP